MYVPELVQLTKEINKRKLREWKMELAIVQNPHVKDPKKLWQDLNNADPDEKKRSEVFDVAGFEKLKQQLRKNPRMVIK